MSELTLNDFDAYFAALNKGTEPFPWQRRLLEQVAAKGRWPGLLDLPTGTGKTAAIDIAVFALALDAVRMPAERTAPRRTILVVDRRTVVDQGYSRARNIEYALREPKEPVLKEVASRLRALAAEGAEGSREPLRAHVLRGGIPRDNEWANSPTQPLVAVSTVDQVGSRLLFRGYGVSSRMQPVHAGLLANDVLFLLDEVHLAQPFRDLLEQMSTRYRCFVEVGLPDRWQVVQMSATADDENGNPFTLEKADHSHQQLAQRLDAKKPVKLLEVKVAGGESKRKQTVADQMVSVAKKFFATGRAIGIVVNRVETARRVYDGLSADVQRSGGKSWLVTGRMRAADRRNVEGSLKDAVGSNPNRASQPLRVVVATQCIEAGADFDFDVLLTECASLDALRQRFGRLNRLGISQDCEGTIFARDDQVKDSAESDPIYGDALRATWSYLQRLSSLDFGISAFALPKRDALQSLLAHRIQAPLLLPTHLDTWVQTSPSPQADPEPGLWLHGPREVDLDVTVVWRADINEALLRTAKGNDEDEDESERRESLERILERLELCPPRSMEGLSIPLSAFRAWLRKQDAADISDAGWLQRAEERKADPRQERFALRWRSDDSEVVSAKDVKPGDTLVVPSDYGGLRDYNWDPEATKVVADLGDEAQLLQQGRGIFRICSAVIASRLGDDVLATLTPIPHQSPPENTEVDDLEQVKGWLTDAQSRLPDSPLRLLVKALGELKSTKLRLVPMELSRSEKDEHRRNPHFANSETWFAVVAKPPIRINDSASEDGDTVEITTDDDYGSLTGVEVTLSNHLKGVESYARQFANGCGLSARLVCAMELAGHWHDVGKADPRFQCWLHGGSAFKAEVAKDLIAKSALSSQYRAVRMRARQRSGYPQGARHELLSLAMMQTAIAPREVASEDWELVLHLVGSHHGHCRPFAPFVPDSNPLDVTVPIDGSSLTANSAHGLERLDSGVPDRFWRLVRRYGWYGLAWLEAIFRLADQQRSRDEARHESSKENIEAVDGN